MIRTRFAPSPTGYLHIGGLRTALYAYLFAKKRGGKFILRIEDTDLERYVDGAVEIIYRTLKEAGLRYDEGPDVGGDYGPYIQSQRRNIYAKYAAELVEKGAAYPCFCSKERLERLRGEGATKYDKHCLRLSKEEIAQRIAAGEPYVIRQNVPETGSTTYTDLVFGDITVDNKDLEDNILIKSDGLPTYNFANVVDDHLMGVDYVIRGVEYLSSTPKYNHLYAAFGWEIPHYIHLQPIMRDATHKLSKRHGDASYEDFIGRGYLKDAIVNYIALLGWSPKDNREKLSLDDMIGLFDLGGISKSPSVFDEAKMRWLNAQYLKELSDGEFHRLALPFYERCGYLKDYDLAYLSTLLKGRCELLSDVCPLTEFLIRFDGFDLALFENKKWKTDRQTAKAMLPELLPLADAPDPSAAFEGYAAEKGYKKGQVLWVFRIAITGSAVTPGGATEMATLLGPARVKKRMQTVITRL